MILKKYFEKIAVFDTVDARFTHQWLDNIDKVLDGRKPDYLVVQHMEPDHSANILNFVNTYPNVKIVSSSKSFGMMKHKHLLKKLKRIHLIMQEWWFMTITHSQLKLY